MAIQYRTASWVRAAVAPLDGGPRPLRDLHDAIGHRPADGVHTGFGTFFMAFGLCALFLASAGLYGVLSFTVTRRTREMGVRSALGANGRALIVLIMRTSVAQLAIGLALGLGLAFLASGALQAILYRVDPRDGAVCAAVTATLVDVSLVASILPARRVTKIDPVLALASE